MNTRALTSTRERRTALLITVVSAAAVVPLVPGWAAAPLLAFVTLVLGKIALEGRVVADAGMRQGKSLETLIKRVELTQSDLVAGLDRVVVSQESARRDLAALAPLNDKLGSVQKMLSTEVASLRRAHVELSQLLETLQRRQERLEALLATSKKTRSKRTRLGHGLDGTPESQLADSISRLNQAIVG